MRKTALFLLLILVLTFDMSCKNIGTPSDTTFAASTDFGTTSKPDTSKINYTTTAKPSETIVLPNPGPENTVYPDLSDYHNHPMIPKENPTIMSDTALVNTIREKIRIALPFLGFVSFPCVSAIYEKVGEISEYHEVDQSYAKTKEDIINIYTSLFTSDYIIKKDLEKSLFATGENPRFKILNDKLLYLEGLRSGAYDCKYDSTIILSYDDDTLVAAVLVSSKISLGPDRILFTTFKKYNNDWYLDDYLVDTTYAESSLFFPLLFDATPSLTKIFGGYNYVLLNGEKVNKYIKTESYYEIEKFMTIDDMKNVLYSVFTDDIAEYYIKHFVDCVFAEDDGKLYAKEFASRADFGVYDIHSFQWLLVESSKVLNYFTIDAKIHWTCNGITKTVYISGENTKNGWRINTPLPMSVE